MKCDDSARFIMQGAGGGRDEQTGLVHCTLDDDHDCPHKGFMVAALVGGALIPIEWAQVPRAVREFSRWSREHGAFAKWQREREDKKP